MDPAPWGHLDDIQAERWQEDPELVVAQPRAVAL
jgi:hypothetical protein